MACPPKLAIFRPYLSSRIPEGSVNPKESVLSVRAVCANCVHLLHRPALSRSLTPPITGTRSCVGGTPERYSTGTRSHANKQSLT